MSTESRCFFTKNRDTLRTPIGNAALAAGPGPDLTLGITDHGLTGGGLRARLAQRRHG